MPMAAKMVRKLVAPLEAMTEKKRVARLDKPKVGQMGTTMAGLKAGWKVDLLVETRGWMMVERRVARWVVPMAGKTENMMVCQKAARREEQ